MIMSVGSVVVRIVEVEVRYEKNDVMSVKCWVGLDWDVWKGLLVIMSSVDCVCWYCWFVSVD